MNALIGQQVCMHLSGTNTLESDNLCTKQLSAVQADIYMQQHTHAGCL